MTPPVSAWNQMLDDLARARVARAQRLYDALHDVLNTDELTDDQADALSRAYDVAAKLR